MNGSLETKLSPDIFPHVDELVRNGRIGICAGNVRFLDFRTGLSTPTAEPCSDRFKLVIPYAGKSVQWEMVFFGNTPRFPPDFIFDDKTFQPDIDSLKCLSNWKSEDRTSLPRLVQELIDAYRSHQVTQIRQHDRILLEYEALIDQSDFVEQDIEVQVDRKMPNGPVNFLIKLPIDFSRIPKVLPEEVVSEESAVLLMTFQNTEGTRVLPQLFLSPKIEGVLGGNTTLKIPNFPVGGCLKDYVPNVKNLITNKIEELSNGFEKRKEYLRAFLFLFGGSVLEYDETHFNKLSFLFEWNDFYFILHIDIPMFFPRYNPVFTLQSIYHTHNDRPFVITYSDYPYSPRWTGTEMAERARTYLLNYIQVFQKASIKSGQKNI